MTTTISFVIPFTIPTGQGITGSSDGDTTHRTALAVWKRILAAKPAGTVTVYAPHTDGKLAPVGTPAFPIPFPVSNDVQLHVLPRQFFAVHANPDDVAMIRNAARILGCR